MKNRWRAEPGSPDTFVLIRDGKRMAAIALAGSEWMITVKNQQGGNAYDFAATAPAAKRMALRMIKREERG